jgi:hypothetical protein
VRRRKEEKTGKTKRGEGKKRRQGRLSEEE